MSDLGALMAAHAEEAVGLITHMLGHQPDFTPDSVVLIEALAGSIHADLTPEFRDAEMGRDPWSSDRDPEIHALALNMGAYVGEVIRRHRGGEWVMEEAEPAMPPSEMLRVEPGLWLNPVGWVHNRILLGPANNVFALFERAMADSTHQA